MQRAKTSMLIMLLTICTSASAIDIGMPDLSVEYDIPKLEMPEYDIPLDKDLQKHIYNLCIENRIPYELVLGVIKCESTFRANIISNGDYGLMQINLRVHRTMFAEAGYDDVLDPYQNTAYAVQYLNKFYKKYKDEHASLMCYNMGESRYLELLKQDITSSVYSRNVMEYKNYLLSIHYGVKENVE